MTPGEVLRESHGGATRETPVSRDTPTDSVQHRAAMLYQHLREMAEDAEKKGLSNGSRLYDLAEDARLLNAALEMLQDAERGET